jgi:hypothetical protein
VKKPLKNEANFADRAFFADKPLARIKPGANRAGSLLPVGIVW